MLPLLPKNHVTNSLDLSQKIQQNKDLLHKIQVVGKHGDFTSKPGSSHTSYDTNSPGQCDLRYNILSLTTTQCSLRLQYPLIIIIADHLPMNLMLPSILCLARPSCSASSGVSGPSLSHSSVARDRFSNSS